MKTIEERLIHFFDTARDWEAWLAKHYEQEEGVWLRFAKKNSQKKSVNYDEALDVALCYGWIDGQTNKYDETTYLQKFTPRRARSMWSKRNTEHVARLIKEGRMRKGGLLQIDAAKKDGRWAAAYASSSNYVIPKDFLEQLEKNKKAKEFFETLTKVNTYAIAWRLQTAKKPETRERRLKAILEMLEKKQKFY